MIIIYGHLKKSGINSDLHGFLNIKLQSLVGSKRLSRYKYLKFILTRETSLYFAVIQIAKANLSCGFYHSRAIHVECPVCKCVHFSSFVCHSGSTFGPVELKFKLCLPDLIGSLGKTKYDKTC